MNVELTDEDYAKCEVLKYEYPFSVRAGRYVVVTNQMCETYYTVDLGNATQEDIYELNAYKYEECWRFIESNVRNLFARNVADLNKPLHLLFETDKEKYITTLLDEWNKAKRKGRTLAAVAAKSPVKKSKWARITKAVLKECAELRAKNVSWQTICDTLRLSLIHI
jgi:hypothetical protein